MIQVRNEVKSYDEKVDAEEEPVVVENHWNQDSLVALTIGGRKVYVVAKDLLAAIHNATNTARF